MGQFLITENPIFFVPLSHSNGQNLSHLILAHPQDKRKKKGKGDDV